LAIQDTQASIDEARSKRKKFEAEAEFYKKKSMPADLAKELRTLDHEIRLQQELLEVKKREFDTIKAKYDADRKRYLRGDQASRRRPPRATGQLRQQHGRANQASQLFPQQIVDLLRIGLALGRLHDLTDQRIEGLFLAGLEFGNIGGVSSQAPRQPATRWHRYR
jgi:hypothetical protein